jgi:hypothetical protein
MDRGGAGWIIFILACIIAFVFLVSALVGAAHAHDQNKPELDSWYRSLQSGKGPCCGGPSEDATHLDELQWRSKGDGYEVFIEGHWIEVPPAAIVPVPNKDGRALVWLYYLMGEPIVRCFIPGQLV